MKDIEVNDSVFIITNLLKLSKPFEKSPDDVKQGTVKPEVIDKIWKKSECDDFNIMRKI